MDWPVRVIGVLRYAALVVMSSDAIRRDLNHRFGRILGVDRNKVSGEAQVFATKRVFIASRLPGRGVYGRRKAIRNGRKQRREGLPWDIPAKT